MHYLIKAIAFDGDGVVINSVPNHFSAFQEAARSLGFKISRKDFDEFFNGSTAKAGIIKYNETKGTKFDPEVFSARKLEITKKFFRKSVACFPDTLGFLQAVSNGEVEIKNLGRIEKNPIIGLVTMLRRATVEILFEQEKWLKQIFQIVVTADDCNFSKPNPECYEKFLSQAGVSPQEAVGIEDTPMGIEALKNAGMLSIGIANTFSREELVVANADIATDELRSLL